MKKHVGLFVTAIIMATVLGCAMQGVGGGASTVKMVPIIGSGNNPASRSMASRNITVSGSSASLSFNQVAALAIVPVVSGWTTDTSSVNTATNTFTSTVLGQTVTTTITNPNGSDVVYSGSFGDGGGTYQITYHTSSNTFDFTQTVIFDYTILSTDPQNGNLAGDKITFLMNVSMMGAQVNTVNNSYSGSGVVQICTFDNGGSGKDSPGCWYIDSAPYSIVSKNGVITEYASVYAYTGTLPTSAPTYSTQPTSDWNSIPTSSAIPVQATTTPYPSDIYLISFSIGGAPNVNDLSTMSLTTINSAWAAAQ